MVTFYFFAVRDNRKIGEYKTLNEMMRECPDCQYWLRVDVRDDDGWTMIFVERLPS